MKKIVSGDEVSIDIPELNFFASGIIEAVTDDCVTLITIDGARIVAPVSRCEVIRYPSL